MYRFFIIFIVGLAQANDAPTVTTAKGIIRGVRSDDGNYNMFMGIPYAKVDETNPFGVSRPYPPFDKVFEANDDSSRCPQIEEFNHTVVGDIDCLRLNIYTPAYVNTATRLPVFVYIFGGGFTIGFYSRYLYGPEYLVRHDIILVVINYRLGPYGFMCLDIPEVPGNQGLKDQIMALRWVQSNIIAFGGDPDKVTIGGNSAGASAVDHHLHRDNNQEKLYNQAILQSGSKPYSYPETLKDVPIVLARYYQFITDDIYQAIAFLATVPPKDIMIATTVLGLKLNDACIEKKFPGVESYTTVAWFQQKPMTANMSFLIGNNDDENCVDRSRYELGKILEKDFLGIYFNTRHKQFQGMSELIERFYLVGDGFGLNVARLYTDMRYLYPSYRNMRKFIENDAAAVYMYNFTYVGTKNYLHRLKLNNIHKRKACHADELGYLFKMEFLPEEPTAIDQLVIDKMTTLWANFVKYGNPTPESSELIDVKWNPVTPTSTFYCMNIDSNLTLTTSSFANRIKFLDLLYKVNEHLRK